MSQITFSPEPKQWVAWQYLNDDHTNEVLFGGGARGGKTWLGCSWIIINCLRFPGSAWLIGRKELKRIKSTTLRTFFKVAQDFQLRRDIDWVYNAQQETITFSNDSVVFLVDLRENPSDPEFDRLGSYDLTGDFIDEAQEVSVKAINVLRGRFSLLSGEGWSTIPKSLYTCNPRKNWIYMDFYKPWKEQRLAEGRMFVPSLVTDNSYVDEVYIENLQKSDKITVQRLLYGNFEYDDDPGVLMKYDSIIALFDRVVPSSPMDYYVSVDVSRFGQDKTVVGIWRGLQLIDIRVYRMQSTAVTTDILKTIAIEYNIPRSRFIIDEDGIGGAVIDNFVGCRGFIANSPQIQHPDTKYDENRPRQNYASLKSQCYFLLAEFVESELIGVNPIDPEMRGLIVEELEQVKRIDVDKESPLRVISKDIVKEYLGRSPDFSDMMMMRMWFELNKTQHYNQPVQQAVGGIKSFDVY